MWLNYHCLNFLHEDVLEKLLSLSLCSTLHLSRCCDLSSVFSLGTYFGGLWYYASLLDLAWLVAGKKLYTKSPNKLCSGQLALFVQQRT